MLKRGPRVSMAAVAAAAAAVAAGTEEEEEEATAEAGADINEINAIYHSVCSDPYSPGMIKGNSPPSPNKPGLNGGTCEPERG